MTYPDNALLRIANPGDLVRAPGRRHHQLRLPAEHQHAEGAVPDAGVRPAGDRYRAGQAAEQDAAAVRRRLSADRLEGDLPQHRRCRNQLRQRAIALTKNFVQNALQDGGKNVLELMYISSADGINRLKEDGYKLANAVKTFRSPDRPVAPDQRGLPQDLRRVQSDVTQNKDDRPTQNRTGGLDYDVNSFAAAVADRWKSRLNNIAMVVDLGPFPRLVTIKGNFDAKKGSEAGYVGDPARSDQLPRAAARAERRAGEGQGHPADPGGACKAATTSMPSSAA